MTESHGGAAKERGQGGGLAQWLSQRFPPEDAAAAEELEVLFLELERGSAIARLLGGIAHELSNMLAPVAGFAELVESAPELSEQTRRWTTILRENATRSADFARTLLAFGRQSRGPRELLNGCGVLDTVLELARYHLQRAHVQPEVQAAPDLPFVEVQPGELQHIFLDIVLRAADRLEAAGGGTLGVRGGAGEDGTVLFEFTAHAGARAADRERAAEAAASTDTAGAEAAAAAPQLPEPAGGEEPGGARRPRPAAAAEAPLPLVTARWVAERLGGTLMVEETETRAVYRLTLPAWRRG